MTKLTSNEINALARTIHAEVYPPQQIKPQLTIDSPEVKEIAKNPAVAEYIKCEKALIKAATACRKVYPTLFFTILTPNAALTLIKNNYYYINKTVPKPQKSISQIADMIIIAQIEVQDIGKIKASIIKQLK